jgi:phospholipid/cholesterol/gamma-HCH transport system substrate-binding protein
MEEYKRNIAVGATTLAGLAGLLILMFLFGRLPLPGTAQQGYTIKVAMPTAGGLHGESRVNLSGVTVGQIESVELREPPHAGVMVRAHIRQNVDIPQGVRATAYKKPLGGTSALELSVPPGTQVTKTLSKTQPPVIEGEAGGMAKQLARELKGTLDEPMARFEKVAGNFNELSTQWTKVGANVNRMVEPRDAAAVDQGKAKANLATVVDRMDQRLREMGKTLSSIDAIVSDDKLLNNLRKTLANARETSDKLRTRVDQVGETLTADADALTKRYIAVADDLGGAIDSLKKLTDQARQGDGTIGKLVNDPSLYQNLNDAAKRINTAVDEMKLLLQKWKAEGVPVQF